MNKIKQLLAILSLAPALCQAQTSTENYVMTETRLDANGTNAIKSVQYYNGLGYPTVSVANVGGSGQTAYSLTTYDAVGREECKYLPVSNDNSILYKTPDNVIAMHSDKTAFSKNNYDALDRVTSVELPGKEWKKNYKRNKSEYLANTDADKVLHYVANPNGKYSLVKPDDKTNPFQYYPANTLTKDVSIDADEKTVETFKDLLGNVILQRTVLDKNKKTYLDTYYVYDAVGQLCYVLSPLYQKNGKKSQTVYEYRYDSRGRQVKKFLPGAEYVQYWYDNADRIVAMQDGVMRKDNVFRFMIYDNLGRLVIQGRCSNYVHNQSYCDKNAVIATFNSGNNGFLGTSYVVPSQFLTAVNNSALLEIANYYDKNQDNIKGDISKYFSDIKITSSVSQNGQQTGSVVAASNGDFTAQVMVYDLKGNLTNTRTREIGGRITSNASTYTYTNKLSFSETYVSMPVGGSLVIGESYNFNNKIDKKSSYTLSLKHGDKFTNSINYAYNELGQLKTITRPLPTSMTRTVTYAYDIRGWLKSITTNSFKEDLFYADCPDSTYNCYNGNIGTMKWSNSNYEQIRGYKFVYDSANRLTDALYGERASLDNKVNRYNEVLEYDENGNITSLQRRGLKQDGQYGKIDNLNLSYIGNQLSSVEEDAKDYDYEGSFEYKRANGSQYMYNENGSLVADKSRKIAYIAYDLNNNPQQIYFTNGNVTKYIYSASGQKLRAIHYTAKPNVTKIWGKKPAELTLAQILIVDSTDYLLGGSLVMKNGKIDKVLFDGGYAQASVATKTTDKFAFNFYNQDHLGNNREVVDAKGAVQQVTNYYPFGAPYADAAGGKYPDLQPYKYNGKELDLMHGLNTYDYGARQHDPILARWDRMDPLCEKYYSISPYAYCSNNPIKLIDPDGKQPVKYIDSDGNKHISWSIVVMVKALKSGSSQKKINHHNKYKQKLQEKYAAQFNHFLNGDGKGAMNSSGDRIISEFKIEVVDVANPQDKNAAKELSKEYAQEIKEGSDGKTGAAAVFMEGGTKGAFGLTNAASLITIAGDAPEGTESHELFHTSGIGDNGYTSGGVLNSPPQPIIPTEVDQLWDILPEKK